MKWHLLENATDLLSSHGAQFAALSHADGNAGVGHWGNGQRQKVLREKAEHCQGFVVLGRDDCPTADTPLEQYDNLGDFIEDGKRRSKGKGN